jgi:hypothetical protein
MQCWGEIDAWFKSMLGYAMRGSNRYNTWLYAKLGPNQCWGQVNSWLIKIDAGGTQINDWLIKVDAGNAGKINT